MKKFEIRLKEIFNDRLSGSVTILQKLIDLFIDEFEIESDNQSKLISNINQIESLLGHFAVVKHFICELKTYLKDNKETNKGKELINNFIRNYDDRWKEGVN